MVVNTQFVWGPRCGCVANAQCAAFNLLAQDKEGALITVQECENDGRPQAGSQWRFGGNQNQQLINELDMCMDLEHQHSHGFMIQWHCKNMNNYKAANQLFNFCEAR